VSAAARTAPMMHLIEYIAKPPFESV